MFLFKDDFSATKTTIRGTRYITVSLYGGEKDVFQKMGDLITESCCSSNVPGVTSESLSDSDMDIENG